jgi:hypothetical protein
VVPFIAGLAGLGAFGVGKWLVGGGIVLGAALFVVLRRMKACGCSVLSKCKSVEVD